MCIDVIQTTSPPAPAGGKAKIDAQCEQSTRLDGALTLF
jgi:hypothetical protein